MVQLPIFETERLILRGISKDDIPLCHQYLIDDEIRGNLIQGGVLLRPESIFPFQGKSKWMWSIFLKSEPDNLIGLIYIKREGDPTHRGFWLAKEHWGKGIITEVITPVMEYAFNTLNFDKMLLGNAIGNKQSRRIKEKEGAVFLRIIPANFVNPKYKERELWELSKERWEGCRGLLQCAINREEESN
jgi:[ribosomal protein S5]-alanine N-acetyltransferase